ncbi:tRNA synthetases class I (W and Y) [Musa troglodytarum]|uniref:tyrosine--tRNA ligase n=1 Tax=Musa troglodytarum TaxID=320322 RepID=A0A9E7FBH5_9LILI|nr:tRNA synthetases class I (W and Y) [Musa troglodytarum]
MDSNRRGRCTSLSYEGDQCEQAGFSWVLCENTDCQLNNKMGGDLKKIQTADICHLGMDQRKTCFLDCRRDMRKCQKAEVNVKIKKGYCPPKIVEGNPCLEYIKHIVFPWCGYFGVMRQVENGGTKMYNNMEELILDYESGALHPADLKPALPKALNVILQNAC